MTEREDREYARGFEDAILNAPRVSVVAPSSDEITPEIRVAFEKAATLWVFAVRPRDEDVRDFRMIEADAAFRDLLRVIRSGSRSSPQTPTTTKEGQS